MMKGQQVARKTLSLVLILKNEADTILDVIGGVAPLYDQLVVGIDRASSDATRALVEPLVRPLADVLYEFDFQDDFAARRNEALRLCWGDFILFPDGHEIIQAASRPYLERVLEDGPSVIPYDVFMAIIRMAQSGSGIVQTQSPRAMLFRNHKNLYFEGKAHNYLWGHDEVRVTLAPQLVFDHCASYYHLADRDEQRVEMNLRIFSQAVRDDPSDVRSWFYLANTYSSIDTDKAIELYQVYLLKARQYGDSPEQVGQGLIYLGHLYLFGKEDYMQAYIAFHHASLITPRAEPFFYMAWIRFKQSDCAIASDLLRHIDLERPPSPFFLEEMVYNGVAVWELWGLCHNALGEYKDAMRCFERVAELQPSREGVQENLEKLRAVCGV